MTATTFRQCRLASRPVGEPKASDFTLTNEPIPTPSPGEVLVRVLMISLDPAMRGWMSGVLLGVGLLVLGVVGLADGQAPRGGYERSPQAGGELVALSHDAGDGRQQITLVDPRQRVIAVYTVDRATGSLQLKSVRNVQWDLTIEDYNTSAPAPRDIRALYDQQK